MLIGRAVRGAVLAGLLGCGGATAQAPASGLVLIVPVPEKMPFDPRSARLIAATDELTRIAGHPVRLVIDAALAQESRVGFEDQVLRAVETIARDMAELREREPATFAYAAPLVETVACAYHAGARPRQQQLDASLDEATHTFHIEEQGPAYELVPSSLLVRVLQETYEKRAFARYSQMLPRDVPPAERPAYFHFLIDSKSVNGDYVENGLSDKRATRILTTLELAALLGPGERELSESVQKWLLHEMDFFVQAYLHHPTAVEGAAQVFHRAEGAWSEWLKRALPKLTDEDRLTVGKGLFVRGFNGAGYPSFAFPGIDKMAFALDVADGWIHAGYPDQRATSTKRTLLYEFFVCPHPVNEAGNRSLGPRCEYDLYRYALADPGRAARLVDFVLQRNDLTLAEAVFVAIRYAESKDALGRTLEIVRMTEKNQAIWTRGMHVIADELAEVSDRARLVDELRRLWAAYPARRGVLLYALAQADRYDNGAIDWAGFVHDYGARVSAAELGAYLDQGPRAMSLVRVVWPALDRGFSRSAVIVPRLEAWMNQPEERAHGYESRDPYSGLDGIGRRLCAEAVPSDLAQFRGYLEGRVKTHPGEVLSPILDATAPAECKKPQRASPPRGTLQ